MKLTKRQLRKIIKEEIPRLSVNDQEYDRGYDDGYNGYRVDVLTDAGDIDKWVLYSDLHHTIELIQRSHRN